MRKLAAAALAAVLALGLWGCQEEQVPGREIARLLEGTWSASTEAGVDYVTFSQVEGTGGQVEWQSIEEDGGVTRHAKGTFSAPGGEEGTLQVEYNAFYDEDGALLPESQGGEYLPLDYAYSDGEVTLRQGDVTFTKQ